MTIGDIPTLNAALNATATILLSTGWVMIKKRNLVAHRACMISAFVVSCLFLVGYVTHKILKGDTTFGGTGFVRTFYLSMLATHVILAIVIVPLVVITFRFALRGNYIRHRAWARWTFPLWLYVSVTGVLVYFFLFVWFPAVHAPV